VKFLREKLTYANVMASLAVFLVLGGATAFAALGKNTVGTKQLKNNAVTTKKIKNGAVTAAKIKDGAVSGAKVDVGSLGTVPTANFANSAGNANTVAGLTLRKFFYTSGTNPAVTTLVSLNGLTISASCAAGVVSGIATTSVNNAIIHAGGSILGGQASFYKEDDTFNVGDTFNFLAAAESDSNQGTITYATPGGGVVTATFLSEEDEGFNTCDLAGTLVG
jgi:hypothetical protein